jgi:hypothetical protein
MSSIPLCYPQLRSTRWKTVSVATAYLRRRNRGSQAGIHRLKQSRQTATQRKLQSLCQPNTTPVETPERPTVFYL